MPSTLWTLRNASPNASAWAICVNASFGYTASNTCTDVHCVQAGIRHYTKNACCWPCIIRHNTTILKTHLNSLDDVTFSKHHKLFPDPSVMHLTIRCLQKFYFPQWCLIYNNFSAVRWWGLNIIFQNWHLNLFILLNFKDTLYSVKNWPIGSIVPLTQKPEQW